MDNNYKDIDELNRKFNEMKDGLDAGVNMLKVNNIQNSLELGNNKLANVDIDSLRYTEEEKEQLHEAFIDSLCNNKNFIDQHVNMLYGNNINEGTPISHMVGFDPAQGECKHVIYEFKCGKTPEIVSVGAKPNEETYKSFVERIREKYYDGLGNRIKELQEEDIKDFAHHCKRLREMGAEDFVRECYELTPEQQRNFDRYEEFRKELAKEGNEDYVLIKRRGRL